MEFRKLRLDGLLEIRPVMHADDRGYFAELFRQDRIAAWAGPVQFVQENQSLNRHAGTVRGLHFQDEPCAQGKLVRCARGAVFDVAVDLRAGSPTYGQWDAIELNAQAGNQVWIPAGFAHGFCTLVPDTVLCYKVTAYYDAAHDRGVAWNDPAIGIAWPSLANPDLLSPKDGAQPRLADLPALFDAEV